MKTSDEIAEEMATKYTDFSFLDSMKRIRQLVDDRGSEWVQLAMKDSPVSEEMLKIILDYFGDLVALIRC